MESLVHPASKFEVETEAIAHVYHSPGCEAMVSYVLCN